jgi:hypothetical protein
MDYVTFESSLLTERFFVSTENMLLGLPTEEEINGMIYLLLMLFIYIFWFRTDGTSIST